MSGSPHLPVIAMNPVCTGIGTDLAILDLAQNTSGQLSTYWLLHQQQLASPTHPPCCLTRSPGRCLPSRPPTMSIPKMPSSRNQDPAHVMDFPSLNLGHAPCSKKAYTLVDLDVTVYGLDEIKGSDRPVAVVVSHLHLHTLRARLVSTTDARSCPMDGRITRRRWRT